MTDIFAQLMQQTRLGELKQSPLSVSGGLMHKMWKVETDQGSFAVKELNKMIQMTPSKKDEFERTEQIAHLFSLQGIPTVCALLFAKKCLVTVEDSTFILYPWTEGDNLGNAPPDADTLEKMAKIFAAMHRLNMQMKEMPKAALSPLSPYDFDALSHGAALKDLNDKAEKTAVFLSKNLLIGHGDLDRKNVLWRNGSPVLIDWESARYLNPTQEIINAALDWSDLYGDKDNLVLFLHMIDAYKKAGGVIAEGEILPAFYGIARNWIEWLLFNYSREERELGQIEVEKTLRNLVFLQNNLNRLAEQIV